MSYKKLEIWQLAFELAVEIHHMTLHNLPKFEMFETGSQIRRSSQSTKSLIVEGYGRRYYKKRLYQIFGAGVSVQYGNQIILKHLLLPVLCRIKRCLMP